jgi:hypothetical protein
MGTAVRVACTLPGPWALLWCTLSDHLPLHPSRSPGGAPMAPQVLATRAVQ